MKAKPQISGDDCTNVHLEMGVLRVSLDRKVRSGVGSLTSQAEQFDSITLAREDAKRP